MATQSLTLADEAATRRFGETLAMALVSGDLVFLEGDLGAGKTALARATIRAASGEAHHEVPSPTFTLVQAYEGLPFGDLLHADLYRLADPQEVDELGLEEARQHGVVLVEWPARAGGLLGEPTFTIALEPAADDSRSVMLTGEQSALDRVDRSLAIRAFLDGAGHEAAARTVLDGDASARSYERILRDGEPDLILMNDPGRADGPVLTSGVGQGAPYGTTARLAQGCRQFEAVTTLLRGAGLRAPNMHAADTETGFLLLEDLGAGRVLDDAGHPIAERYQAAAETLAHLHGHDWSTADALPPYDHTAMMIELELLLDWYLPRNGGAPVSDTVRDDFHAIWDSLIDTVLAGPQTLVLRDFHSPNIIWDDTAQGTDRIGIIDHQDALFGPLAYDVASLAQDARVDMDEPLEARIVARYIAQNPALDEAQFLTAYAIMAAQRASKIAGIFVRLNERDGKSGYLAHLPRMEAYLERATRHPALAEYRAFLREHVGLKG